MNKANADAVPLESMMRHYAPVPGALGEIMK